MKYSDFFKFLESKDRFINSNPNLTLEQKAEIKAFFQKHPNYENKIDWNKAKNLTYEDFMPILALEGKSVSAVKKGAGIEGLTEGHDYILLGSGAFNGSEWHAYQPLTYYASRLIASKFVRPEVDAQWCTAWQKDRRYWDRHAFKSKESFIYLCGESIPTKKVAITASMNSRDCDNMLYSYCLPNGLRFNIWNANDKKEKILDKLPPEIPDLIPISYENRELVIQLHDEDIRHTEEIKRQQFKNQRLEIIRRLKFNQSTRRYDSEASLSFEALSLLIVNGKFELPFGVIKGDFICDGLNIVTLENGPTEVEGDFSCKLCAELTSLYGAPKKVGGNFICDYDRKLTSLEGAPEYVGHHFSCDSCSGIVSLKGVPKYVGGSFSCCLNYELTSLEYAPEYVGESFDCDSCKKIKSLIGVPERINRDFSCNGCSSLVSLKGSPKFVGGEFSCRFNDELKSLKNGPTEVGSYNCCCCSGLTSLEGAPKEIKGDFHCENCSSLESLAYAPEVVEKNFVCYFCGKKFRMDDVRKVCKVKGKIVNILR